MDTFENEPTKEQRIWQTVAAIPEGKVASYGQVAAMAGLGALCWPGTGQTARRPQHPLAPGYPQQRPDRFS